MAWLSALFGSSGSTGAAAAPAATVPASTAPAAVAPVGGVGAGLTGVGGGTFGGLGGVPTTIGAGTPGLSVPGLGAMPAYGLGGVTSPSLLTGAGSLTGLPAGSSLQGALMSNQVFQPTVMQRVQGAAAQLGAQRPDLIDGILQGLTLSDPPPPPVATGERGVPPSPLPNQVQTLRGQVNQGRMGFNQNGILSWLPASPQVPQPTPIPGQLQMGPYRG